MVHPDMFKFIFFHFNLPPHFFSIYTTIILTEIFTFHELPRWTWVIPVEVAAGVVARRGGIPSLCSEQAWQSREMSGTL